jgi:hypothetical protein
VPDEERPRLPAKALTVTDADAALARHGLRVVWAIPDAVRRLPYLALQLAGGAVDRVFRDTHWQKGVWAQALDRVPGALRRRQRMEAGRTMCLMLPLTALTGDIEAGPEAPPAAAPDDDIPC